MRAFSTSLRDRAGLSALVFLTALALAPVADAALSDSERERLAILAGEWGEIAQRGGPVAADPGDAAQPPEAIERALAGAAMGDAVVNIATRDPDQLAEAVATAVALAPALAEPIATRVARAYPERQALIAAAAVPPPAGEIMAQGTMTAETTTAETTTAETTTAEAVTEEAAAAPEPAPAAATPSAPAAPDEPTQFAEIEAALYEADQNNGEAEELNDPYEGVNRFIFAVNDLLDTVVFRPLASIYGFVAPTEVKGAVRKFYRNLNEPVVFVNKLLQFEGEEALVTLGRFAVNSTAGGAGFFEVAEDWGMPAQSADFGQTLYTWGVPRGNYLVIPIVGPSNTRFGVGRIVDIAFNPRTYLLSMPANGGLTAGFAISFREQLLQPLDQLRTGSIDYYTAIKSVYWQNRMRALRGEQTGDEFRLGDENLDSDFDSIE